MAAIKTVIQGPWLRGFPWKTLRGFPHYRAYENQTLRLAPRPRQ
jgi:hypothetical protein